MTWVYVSISQGHLTSPISVCYKLDRHYFRLTSREICLHKFVCGSVALLKNCRPPNLQNPLTKNSVSFCIFISANIMDGIVAFQFLSENGLKVVCQYVCPLKY